MAGMEYWETCVFFCFSYSPCCYQASGRDRVYGSTSATKKSILLPKNSHTQSYSVSHVRGSITRHISIQQFSEKNRKYQTNFQSAEGSISLQHLLWDVFWKLFIILFRDTVDNCILDFTPRMLYKFSWLPAFWELFLEALTSLLLTLHVAWSKWNHT